MRNNLTSNWLIDSILKEFNLSLEELAKQIDVPIRILKNIAQGKLYVRKYHLTCRKLLAYYCYLSTKPCLIQHIDQHGEICYQDIILGSISCNSALEIRDNHPLYICFDEADRRYIDKVADYEAKQLRKNPSSRT